MKGDCIGAVLVWCNVSLVQVLFLIYLVYSTYVFYLLSVHF